MQNQPAKAKRGPYALFYAWAMAVIASGHDVALAQRKRSLLGDLHGTVVEIGPGTGPNLAYYAPDVRWVGIEPNGYMNHFLEAEARRLRREIDVRTSLVETLPFEDESIDHVVGTLVLCSVHDQDRALREIRRVLKPGGHFVFVEHVAAPDGTPLHRLQNLITPAWRLVSDGCRPNLRTWEAIPRSGFHIAEIERFQISAGPFGPHIAGYAVK